MFDTLIMRLWTIHPKYLDSKGLVALWREALLAQKVLQDKTKGYKNHPQLIRFKNIKNPLAAVGKYLEVVYQESLQRGYSFDFSKIVVSQFDAKIDTTKGQLLYEFEHLQNKLEKRDINKYKKIKTIKIPDANPIFNIIDGGAESWEIITPIK